MNIDGFYCGQYQVISHGNGWAYTVIDKQTKRSLWFQDGSAATLREQTQDFKDPQTIKEYFEMASCD